MAYPWGDYYAGECVHGEPAETCATCYPPTRSGTWTAALLGLALWCGLLVLFGRAYDHEEAAAMERARPSIERLREVLATEDAR